MFGEEQHSTFGEEQHSTDRSAHSRRLAIFASVLTHVVWGAIAIWVSMWPRSVSTPPTQTVSANDLVWIAMPGPGGGGGGGGDQTKAAAPARQMGRDRLSAPIAPDPKPAETPTEPPPLEPLPIPAQPIAAATEVAPGVIDPSPPSDTLGAGSRGGAGTGTGTGSGAGQGSGLGPGFGGGTGGGAYRPGSGVSSPQLVREIKPNYTADAMRAKMQGVVLLECVVLTDGTVGDIKVLKSLDKVFGLDEEAIKAAKQWRFVPGRRFGEPVPVLVTIELGFTLR